MKDIIDRCCIIAFGLVFTYALFGLNGNLTETNRRLKQISTDIQDLTDLQQTEKRMACSTEAVKNTSIEKWSEAISNCFDIYKTRSQEKNEFYADLIKRIESNKRKQKNR